MRRQQDLGAVVDEVLERGDGGADAGVVGDLEVLVERDVEVGADLESWKEVREEEKERGKVREGKKKKIQEGVKKKRRTTALPLSLARSLKRLFFFFFACLI